MSDVTYKQQAEAHVRELHGQNPSWVREQAEQAIDVRVAICKPSLDELAALASGDGKLLADFITDNHFEMYADPEAGLLKNRLFLQTCWRRLQQLLALAGEEQTEGVSM